MAARARRSTSKPRSGTPRPTIASKSPGAWDVRTVTPTSARSTAAPAEAASIARPPRQCTVAIATPRSRAAATAPATALGISCHLRSRNTFMPRATNSRTSAGPSRTYSIGPIFAHLSPGRRAARARASRPLGKSRATTSSATDADERPRDALGRARGRQRRRAHGDERRARRQVFVRVAAGADAAHADHPNVHLRAHEYLAEIGRAHV